MAEMHDSSLKGFLIWGLCALFFLYEFLLRTVLGTFQHPIMYDLDLTSFQFSILSSTTYLIIYGLMQIPVGLIVDRIGLKKSLSIGALICWISAIGFSYSYQFPMAVFFRMLAGLGSSFGFICLLVAVYDWLPNRYAAFFIGVSQFIGVMGPMLAAGPLDSLASSSDFSWRSVFLMIALVGIILNILIFIFVRNAQSQLGAYIMIKPKVSVFKSLRKLFSRPQPIFIAIFSALLYFLIEYLSENEGKSFLVVKGFSPNFAAYMITIAWLGYGIGAPFVGWISDLYQRRVIFMRLSALICVMSFLGIIFSEDKTLTTLSFFFLGLGAAGQSLGFVIMAEQCKKADLGLGLSLNNAFITSCIAFNAPVIGWMIDFSAQGKAFRFVDYERVFLIVAAAFAPSHRPSVIDE